MSEKKFEECSLQEATHVEVNGVVYNIAGNICTYNIGLRWLLQDVWIPIDWFPTLGIKPMREIKPEPREFVHIFRKGSSMSYPSWAENGMFRCVEILEDEE